MDAAVFRKEALKHQRLLWRVSWSMLGNPEDCAEAVRETLTLAWQQRGAVHGRRALRPLLVRTLTRVCGNKLRLRTQTAAPPPEEVTQPPETPGSDLVFREALQCLSPEQRIPMVLRYLERCSAREIEQMTGAPESMVKSRLAYARIRLQSLLGGEWYA